METLSQKNLHHKRLYNSLASEYKMRALDQGIQKDLLLKAKSLKSLVSGQQALEIGLGGGQMNRILKEVGFETTGIDIAEKMVENTKAINPGGKFIVGDYLASRMKQKYDLIAGLAFIHLFTKSEAKRIIWKMYDDLSRNGVLHLTTTKECRYSYGKYNKSDYGPNYPRYRAKHSLRSFIGLLKSAPFVFEKVDIEHGADGKQRMSLIARKK